MKGSKYVRNSLEERPKWNQHKPRSVSVVTPRSLYSHCGACHETRRRKESLSEILSDSAEYHRHTCPNKHEKPCVARVKPNSSRKSVSPLSSRKVQSGNIVDQNNKESSFSKTEDGVFYDVHLPLEPVVEEGYCNRPIDNLGPRMVDHVDLTQQRHYNTPASNVLSRYTSNLSVQPTTTYSASLAPRPQSTALSDSLLDRNVYSSTLYMPNRPSTVTNIVNPKLQSSSSSRKSSVLQYCNSRYTPYNRPCSILENLTGSAMLNEGLHIPDSVDHGKSSTETSDSVLSQHKIELQDSNVLNSDHVKSPEYDSGISQEKLLVGLTTPTVTNQTRETAKSGSENPDSGRPRSFSLSRLSLKKALKSFAMKTTDPKSRKEENKKVDCGVQCTSIGNLKSRPNLDDKKISKGKRWQTPTMKKKVISGKLVDDDKPKAWYRKPLSLIYGNPEDKQKRALTKPKVLTKSKQPKKCDREIPTKSCVSHAKKTVNRTSDKNPTSKNNDGDISKLKDIPKPTLSTKTPTIPEEDTKPKQQLKKTTIQLPKPTPSSEKSSILKSHSKPRTEVLISNASTEPKSPLHSSRYGGFLGPADGGIEPPVFTDRTIDHKIMDFTSPIKTPVLHKYKVLPAVGACSSGYPSPRHEVGPFHDSWVNQGIDNKNYEKYFRSYRPISRLMVKPSVQEETYDMGETPKVDMKPRMRFRPKQSSSVEPFPLSSHSKRGKRRSVAFPPNTYITANVKNVPVGDDIKYSVVGGRKQYLHRPLLKQSGTTQKQIPPYLHTPGYDNSLAPPYASYTSNGTYRNGMRATFPPTGRGMFGKFRPTTYASPNVKNDYPPPPHMEPQNSRKPKVITVVWAGNGPGKSKSLKKITVLLNRNSVQSFEQLLSDISGACGWPKWKNKKIEKLFTVKGREVASVSDFFREDNVFIATGKEQLTTQLVQDVMEELYPDSPYAQSLVRQNLDKSYKDRKTNRPSAIPEPSKGSKSDSGLGDSTEGDRQLHGGYKPIPAANRERVLHERRKFQGQERLKAKKWGRGMLEREQRELDEMRKKKDKHRLGGSPPPNQPNDLQLSLRQAERRQREKEQWEEEERDRQRRKEVELQEKRRREERELKRIEDERRQREEEDDKERRRQERLRREEEEDRRIEEARLQEENERKERDRRKWEQMEKERLEEERIKELERKRKEEQRLWDEEQKQREAEEERRRKEQHDHDMEEERRRKERLKQDAMNRNKTDNKGTDDNDRLRRSPKFKRKSRVRTSKGDIEARYEIGKTIGDGNFAVVKECRLRTTESEFAMKIIDKSKMKGKEEMIENEIAIMRHCNHQNIVRLIEVHETDDDIYLILEYVKGGDLFDAITEAVKFTEDEAALMVHDLCSALAFLHKNNIVHRDLKPENLLVARNADGLTLKLADFGLSMEVGDKKIFTVCGTPTYVAPEILMENGYGLEVDMWATGVILYILLCGFPPFRSPTRDQEELFDMIQHGEYEFLSPYWDKISFGAKDLIRNLLVVDKNKRYTAEQVLQHRWIKRDYPGGEEKPNLQREVTRHIEKNFGRGPNRRKPLTVGL